MTEEKITEIKIRPMEHLSKSGQREVIEKIANSGKTLSDFSGYAKIFYTQNSPLKVVKVEPIFGNILEHL